MTNIVSIDTHPARLRPGDMALHAEYGWVEIIERAGSRRKIRWVEHAPIPPRSPRHEVTDARELSAERLTVWEDWIEGKALKGASRPTVAQGFARRRNALLATFGRSPGAPAT